MRVLVVHNRYRSAQPSGENAVVEDETSLLADHGCDVRRLEVESDEIASWPARRRALLPLRVVWSATGYRLVEDGIRSFRPDIVHFHNTFPLLSPAALWAARRSGTAVVQTLHNFRPLCPAATFLRDGRPCEDCLGRLPWRGVLHGCYRNSRSATAPLALAGAIHGLIETPARCVDLFLAPSAFTRTKYVEAGWPSERIEVKYNTVRDEGRRRAGSGDDIVCVSRLSPEKGVGFLLTAWGIAFPSGGPRLVVVGSGESEPELRRQAAALRGVELVGRLDRAATLDMLAGARAAVIPSRCYEGFPRALVEAYSLGVPVIGSRLGALAELVGDMHTGLLVDPDSPADLARALRTLAYEPELAERLGDGARDAYEERFSPERTTARLLDLYARAAGEKAQTRARTYAVAAAG